MKTFNLSRSAEAALYLIGVPVGLAFGGVLFHLIN